MSGSLLASVLLCICPLPSCFDGRIFYLGAIRVTVCATAFRSRYPPDRPSILITELMLLFVLSLRLIFGYLISCGKYSLKCIVGSMGRLRS